MLLRQFFAPRQGDFEIDPNAIGEDYRLSSGSQQSLNQMQSNQSSRQSVTGPNGAGSAYGGMPPPGARPTHQRGQPSMSAAGGISGPNGGGPFLHTQPSTLTQGSAASSVNQNPGGAMKVKVFFQEDIIAIRVSTSVSFAALKQKLIDRLRVKEDVVIQYKDEQTNSYIDMENDDHLEVALSRNPKLTLYVAYVADA
jgi:bud emergence protein 1